MRSGFLSPSLFSSVDSFFHLVQTNLVWNFKHDGFSGGFSGVAGCDLNETLLERFPFLPPPLNP